MLLRRLANTANRAGYSWAAIGDVLCQRARSARRPRGRLGVGDLPRRRVRAAPERDGRGRGAICRGIRTGGDLKSVWTATHSHAVGVMAAAAGEAAGLAPSAIDELRIAGWLHDLRRVAVPNMIWDKPGPLNAAEWEQVRLHAYHTERLLARSPLLAPVAELAGAIHERCDGSGYPKNARAAQLDQRARLLSACDVYCALCEDRPHRPAFSADEAASILLEEAGRGALDHAAVRHVLDAAGVATTSPPSARRAGHPPESWRHPL